MGGLSTTESVILFAAILMLPIIAIFMTSFLTESNDMQKLKESRIYWTTLSDDIRLKDWSLKSTDYVDGIEVNLTLMIFNPTPEMVRIKQIDILPGRYEFVRIDGKSYDAENFSFTMVDNRVHEITVQQFCPRPKFCRSISDLGSYPILKKICDAEAECFVPRKNYAFDAVFRIDESFNDVYVEGPPLAGTYEGMVYSEDIVPNPPYCMPFPLRCPPL